MPSFIVKADPVVDWYCIWSTVVDAPYGWGTRAELTAEAEDAQEVDPARFERADKNGTSARIPGTRDADQWFGWNDAHFILMEDAPPRPGDGAWLLPRCNLRAFCEALQAGEDTTPLLKWEQHEDG